MTLLIGLLLSLILTAVLWYSLPVTRSRHGDNLEQLTDSINKLLPQTQCGQCQYPGCLPYARAIARGQAGIDRCPPGGPSTVRRIAALLGEDVELPDGRLPPPAPPGVARIDEQHCIGCVKCIQACPVDAIIGAPKQLHGVIESECTGCELCLPSCPVDCITMQTVTSRAQDWVWTKPASTTGNCQ